MKYFITLLTLVFLGLSVFAQEGQELSQPPQIFPVSPEAASLGKYGEIPVNLSTGKINHTIPLHTINESGFSLPISLSYNYSGLMVDEISGASGLGWDFSGKGMITRQIRGKADESSLGYIGPNQIGKKVYQYHTNSQSMSAKEIGDLLRESSTGRWDTESDKYIISVGSLSATFYFNHEGEAIFAPYKNYELNRLPNNGGFELIDDKGIRYYFIDKENSEQEVINRDSPIQNYISAWVINRIVLPNNKEITFEYTPYHTRQKIYSDASSSIDLTWPQYNECRNKGFVGVSNTVMLSQTFGLMVKKITTPSETVNFDYTVLDALNAPEGHNPVILEAISIDNNVGEKVMRYSFEYQDKMTKRKLLSSIYKGKNEINRDDTYYKFEYYGNAPEDIAYYKQDYWGYYSGGKNTSGSLILSGTNRSTDFESTRLGALKKIYYPTKGYSEILYEQNTVVGRSDIGGIEVDDQLNGNVKILFSSDRTDDTQDIDTLITRRFTPSKLVNQQITRAEISYTLYGSIGYSLVSMSLRQVGCTNSPECIIIENHVSPEQEPVRRHEERKRIQLKPNVEYELSMKYERTGFPTNSPRILGDAFIGFYSRPEPDDPNGSEPHNISFGGIRVNTVKSCDGTNNCITKLYNYNDEDGNSTAIVLARSQYRTREFHHYAGKSINDTSPPIDCDVTKTTSSSNVALSTYIGSPVLYKTVEESIVGTNDKDLKTRYHFSGRLSGFDAFPYAPIEQRNWRKGLTIKQESLKIEGSTYLPVVKTTNTYTALDRSSEVSGKSYNLKVGQVRYDYTSQGFQVNYTYKPSHFIDSRYVHYSELYPISSSVQEEIHHNKTITQNSSYTYDNPYGQLKTQTTTDSNGSTITTTHTYPYDKSSIVNNLLVAQNRITTPIETKTTKNATVLGAQVTEFKDWGNGIILPEVTKIGKGTKTSESRLIYHKYDSQGNPLEVSQESGRHMMYIWGYHNTQPIVKIDNASYAGIPAAVTTLINQLKTTSDTENSEAKENTMHNLFKALRDHSYFANAQVSGYTYDPLIGVTTMTNPKGETVYYQYDDLNRLQYILNRDGHIVQKTNYNYANQQTNQYGTFNVNVTSPGLVTPNKPITFTASFAGSAGQFLYTWKVNGAQEQCDSSPSFIKTFSSEGEYTISVLAYDTQTKRSVSKILVVSVKYPTLTAPAISNPYTHVVKGTSITYSVSNIGGGSGDLRYEWYVNGVKQTTTSTSYSFTNLNIGTYNTYFKVIDNKTGKSANTATRTLKVYSPLTTPSLTASKYYIVTGTTVNFSAGNISGGSGSRRYEWYVNNVKQSSTGTSFSYKYTGLATYAVKFKVVDNILQNGTTKEASTSVTAYYSMTLKTTASGGNINTANGSVRFNLDRIVGGSGSFETPRWRAFNSVTPSITHLSGTGDTFRLYNTPTGTHEYSITVTVKDLKTGEEKTHLMVVISSHNAGDNGGGNTGDQH